MLPEGPLLDVVDEADGCKVHISSPLLFNDVCLRYVRGIDSVGIGTFRRELIERLDSWAELCGAKDVREEAMVV